MFRRVLAVEIDPTLCQAAEDNLRLNGVDNAVIFKSPSHDFCQKVLRHKTWTDKQSGYKFDFGCVLVDPPRAGLDARTRALVSRYDHILYVSCSPYISLRRDVDDLAKSGLKLRQLCLLDHFPYTHHAECAVYLSRV